MGTFNWPRGWLETDYRLSRRLGLSIEEADKAMRALWGHPYSTERDRLVGTTKLGAPGTAQRRGQIGRRLQTQLARRADTERRITGG